MQNLQGIFHDGGASNAKIESAKSEVLETVAYTLLRQVYGVTEPKTLDVLEGVDFYEEVRRFEVSLIYRGKPTSRRKVTRLDNNYS